MQSIFSVHYCGWFGKVVKLVQWGEMRVIRGNEVTWGDPDTCAAITWSHHLFQPLPTVYIAHNECGCYLLRSPIRVILRALQSRAKWTQIWSRLWQMTNRCLLCIFRDFQPSISLVPLFNRPPPYLRDASRGFLQSSLSQNLLHVSEATARVYIRVWRMT